GDDLSLTDAFADLNERTLVDTGVLVRTLELDQRIDIGRHLARAGAVDAVVGLDDDAFRIDVVDHAVTLGDNDRTGIACGDALHAGPDIGRFGTQKRNRLTLHVRAHESTVGVVILKERNERCRDRHELFRRDVHILDVGTVGGDEFTAMACGVPLVNEIALRVKLDIRLADDPFILFPRSEIERIWLELGLLPAALGDLAVRLFDIFQRGVLVRLKAGVAAVVDLNVFDNATVHDPAVRRFDKAVLIDPGKARKRRDKADVRAFRRLDRTDAAVVRRVDVADLKARTLTRKPARPKGRKAAFVRDLRQRVRLVHELRQL